MHTHCLHTVRGGRQHVFRSSLHLALAGTVLAALCASHLVPLLCLCKGADSGGRTSAEAGVSERDPGEPSWKGQLNACCCCGERCSTRRPRSTQNPLSPRLAACRRAPSSTRMHTVADPCSGSSRSAPNHNRMSRLDKLQLRHKRGCGGLCCTPRLLSRRAYSHRMLSLTSSKRERCRHNQLHDAHHRRALSECRARSGRKARDRPTVITFHWCRFLHLLWHRPSAAQMRMAKTGCVRGTDITTRCTQPPRLHKPV